MHLGGYPAGTGTCTHAAADQFRPAGPAAGHEKTERTAERGRQMMKKVSNKIYTLHTLERTRRGPIASHGKPDEPREDVVRVAADFLEALLAGLAAPAFFPLHFVRPRLERAPEPHGPPVRAAKRRLLPIEAASKLRLRRLAIIILVGPRFGIGGGN